MTGLGLVEPMGHGSTAYNLCQAWSVWAEDRLKHTDTLYHIPIVWWGRIGRCADFLAALLLLIDVLKLAWFQRFSAWAKAWDKWLRLDWFRSSGNRDPSAPKEPFGGEMFYVFLLAAPLFVPVFILAFKEYRSGAPSLPRLQPWVDRCDTSWLCQAFVELPAFLLLCAISALIGHFLLFRWIVWMANLPMLSFQLKILALCLLIFGFHFTLLGM